MSKNKEAEVNEVNLKADKNENNIPDWAEFTATYIIAAVCVSMAVAGYVRQDLDGSIIKWLLGFGVVLTGGRDAIKAFIKRKVG
ncbi:MAG: hypothetical protein K9K76_10775 [Halanaerobiales bacterium]|nr:hypothetical protein [Halanaerobiales bacterium]